MRGALCCFSIEVHNMDKSELIAGMTADSADTENALRIPRSD